MTAYLAYIVAFLAMCCYASLGTMAKKITSAGIEGYHLIFLNSVLLAGFSIIALLFASDRNFQIFKSLPLTTWGWTITWAGVNFIGFALYLYAIQRVAIVEYQIMYLASPIIAAFLAYILLTEPIQLKHIIGGLIVALGVYIAIRK